MPAITSVVDHISQRHDKPWLIVGKGPSAIRFPTITAGRPYHLFTLNHACVFLPEGDTDSVAHFMDLEAAQDCADILLRRHAPLCLPWYPHVKFKPRRESLIVDPQIAGSRSEAFTVLSYNSTIAGNLPRNPNLPTIRVRFFSAVAAFNILAAAGCRDIYSLGLDGGNNYAPQFHPKDKLANGRKSFDVQFSEIARTIQEQNVVHKRI